MFERTTIENRSRLPSQTRGFASSREGLVESRVCAAELLEAGCTRLRFVSSTNAGGRPTTKPGNNIEHSCHRAILAALNQRKWSMHIPPANDEKLLIGLMAMVFVAAVFVLAVDSMGHGRDEAQSRQFQELLHGFGLGPALDLSTCEFSFDPRLNKSCPWDCLRTPGGIDFCPIHATSLLPYQTMRID